MGAQQHENLSFNISCFCVSCGPNKHWIKLRNRQSKCPPDCHSGLVADKVAMGQLLRVRRFSPCQDHSTNAPYSFFAYIIESSQLTASLNAFLYYLFIYFVGKFIPLWHIILKLPYVMPSATTNGISHVNTCYMFRPYSIPSDN